MQCLDFVHVTALHMTVIFVNCREQYEAVIPPHDEPMSDFDRLRKENIERNEAFLKSLGMPTSKSQETSAPGK